MDAKNGHCVGALQTQSTPVKPLPGRQQVLIQTRFLPAAPAAVYDLWAEPALLVHWYAEPGFAVVQCEGRIAIGSDWRLVLRAPDDRHVSIQRQFLQVEPARRLQYCEQCSGSNGVFYAAMTVVTFEKLASKTKLTVRAEPDHAYDDTEIAEWQQGTNALLERLLQQLQLLRATRRESLR